MEVNIHEAKTHLSRLLERVAMGEEVIIAKRDKPLVRLEAVRPKKTKRKLGWGKGLVTYIAPDFDESLEDFGEYMETAEEEKMRLAKRKGSVGRK